MAAAAKDGHARIDFNLEAAPQNVAVLDEERKKHQNRAERFGTGYVDPGQRREFRLEARKERLAAEGFATGIDLFSVEEKAKRAARATKFGLPVAERLAYAPDPEEAKKAERGAKFGTGYHADGALMDMDLLEGRADPTRDAPRRPEAVYLYGIDVMSTADVKAYFGNYGPRFVEWINDSSCVVLFADAATAARAIVGTGHPLPPEQQAPDAEGQAGLDPTSIDSLPFLWHKGRDFVKGGTVISLMYRMATVADRKDENAPRRSRYLWKAANGPAARGKRVEPDGEYGGGGGGDGDAEMRRARGERGGHQLRRQRRKRIKQADGSYRDVEMEDAGDSGHDSGGADSSSGRGCGGSGRREWEHAGSGAGSGGAAAEDPEATARVTEERFGVQDLRELLRRTNSIAAAGRPTVEAGAEEQIGKLQPEAFEEVVPAADDEKDASGDSGGGGSGGGSGRPGGE